IHPDRRRYLPGERARVRVATTNEKERLTPALALVAVVDKSVVTLADDKTARAMPTHFLLTSEVRKPEDLEYADFLLGPHPRAAQALDLLLGTQGWRRFAEQDPEEFRRKNEKDREGVERLLVLIGHSATTTRDADREK